MLIIKETSSVCVRLYFANYIRIPNLIVSSTPRTRYFPGTRLNERSRTVPVAAVSRRLCRRDTERRGGELITLQVDVVDARFAGLKATHYLPKEFVFDLQCITE
jgi:hypothetical protein